jgi:hypothetical protein
MKKVFFILFAALILLAGMHLSIAKHICGGEVAAIKWSFSGKIADCGMETNKSTCPFPDGIASHCCQNEIAYYAVDSNYSPSTFQLQNITSKISQVISLPVNLFSHLVPVLFSTYTNGSPPRTIFTSDVSLTGICILRI